MNIKKLTFMSLAAALIIGCNDSSSSTSSTTTNTSKESGQLIDSPISGIDYSSDSGSGVTDKNGIFYFQSGDRIITFSVGKMKISDFVLSKINIDRRVFPADLFDLDRSNTTDDRVIKIIQFLQSLDNDNNASNGIVIDEDTKDKLNQLIENNSSIKTYVYLNDFDTLKNIVEKLNKKWIIENEAREHYKNTLLSYGYEPDEMPFTTLWKVDSTDLTININTLSNYEYNFNIDWGDGTKFYHVTGPITHTYEMEGYYIVKIIGTFPGIQIYSSNDINNSKQILEVIKWGDIKWKTFNHAFNECNNLKINANDFPNLKNVEDMSYAFASVKTNTFKNIGLWDVSNVKNMSHMFDGATNFNQPLNDWNVSSVTNMSHMFDGATNFNQPLNNWNVSNVKYMNGMFKNAWNFNQPLDNWNVSKVENMSEMFYYATNFNQPLNNWNVSNVKYMNGMFLGAYSFNQPLNDWNVSKVENMSEMFKKAYLFNKPLNDWNVSSVTDMSGMFEEATSFNQSLNNWNVSNVTDMSRMFKGAFDFNQSLNNWDVSNVTDMSEMFYNNSQYNIMSFDQNISMWDDRNVQNYNGFGYRSPLCLDHPEYMPPRISAQPEACNP
ncbi:BspA family leucine-rich repeat surface protein [Nautilia lithotrophica]